MGGRGGERGREQGTEWGERSREIKTLEKRVVGANAYLSSSNRLEAN